MTARRASHSLSCTFHFSDRAVCLDEMLKYRTDTTWEIHMAGMSKAWRRILQYLALPDEERTYPRMLEIDTYARLCFDHIGNMEGRERWDDVNKMTWHALRRYVPSFGRIASG